jgi:hypothetical protein
MVPKARNDKLRVSAALRSAMLIRMSSLMVRSVALVCAWLGTSACQGTVSTPSEGSGAAANGSGSGSGSGATGSGGTAGSAGEACTSPADASKSVLRRLSKLEYQLTLQELFRLAEPPDVSSVPEDSDQEGFRTIAALENVSDQHLRAYVDIASDLASALLADPARRTEVLDCEIASEGCLASFARSFGKLAYRREVEDAEVTDLVTRATAAALDTEDEFRFVIESLLSSPSFVFRVEVGGGEALATLSPVELASRLSFTLWGRSPSVALLDRALNGELDDEAGIAKVADELLADERAAHFFRAFFKQWLDFDELRVPSQPPPGWSDALLPAMISETERLLDEFAWGPDRSLPDVLTANFTFSTPELATFYGMAASGSGFSRVEFPAGHQRENTGLLTHASLISAKRDGDIIPARGKWLRQSFLCEKLEVPAGLLEGLETELAGLSYVEVIQMRNTDTACAGCHALIDPLGAAFVQYDGVGYYDETISPSEFGLVPRFQGAENPDITSLAALSNELKKMPELAPCIADKMFVYTQGRFPQDQDRCALEQVGRSFAEEGFRFPALARALVTSPAFRLRRAGQ